MSFEELDTSANQVANLKFQEPLEHHAVFRCGFPHGKKQEEFKLKDFVPLDLHPFLSDPISWICSPRKIPCLGGNSPNFCLFPLH